MRRTFPSFASSDSNIQRHVRRNMMTFDSREEGEDAFWTSQSTRAHPRPLDKIPPNIVAKVNMEAIRVRAEAINQPWSTKLMRYYDNGFPRVPTTMLKPESLMTVHSIKPPRNIKGQALTTVKALREAGILGTSRERRRRGWVSVFQVPKNEEVDRAIINCKDVNQAFDKPPPLSLAEIGTLLGLISFFPDAVISTADIRHFFWQLRLATADRPLFSMSAEGLQAVLECIALPMGWSWSPWVAQGVAGLAVAEAAVRLSRQLGRPVLAVPGGQVSEDSPPPYWYIIDEQADRVCAIVVIWYDNFLVAAARPSDAQKFDWNQAVRSALNTSMDAFKIAWKLSADGLPWTVGFNEAEYIGIHFSRINGDFAWRHIDANISSWSATKADDFALTMPLVELAQALGVIAWDAHVRLGKRMGTEIRELMSAVGSTYHGAQSTNLTRHQRDAQDVTLTPPQLLALQKAWTLLLDNLPCTAPERLLTNLRLLASDATPLTAAGVILDVDDGIAIPIDVDSLADAETHINCVETVAAIRTVIHEFHRTAAENTLFAIAVDNTTAVAWFNGRTALHPLVQRELEAMDALLATRDCRAWAWWEPTATQPADEPSKNKPLDRKKVFSCRARLEESALTGLTQLTLPAYRSKVLAGDVATS